MDDSDDEGDTREVGCEAHGFIGSRLMPAYHAMQWMLGFVDAAESPSDLLRHRFPSKVGGRPVS